MDEIIVVVGHGSHRDPDAGVATAVLAAGLCQRGIPARHAFLKQAPELDTVLSELAEGTPVLLVPHFAGDGSFSTHVIPDIVARFRSRLGSVRIMPALGTTPLLAPHLRQMADSLSADLLLVAHGSKVGDAAAEQAAQQTKGRVVYLERDPRLEHWADLPLGPRVLVAVLLAARGRHACEDVPSQFGIVPYSPLITADNGPVGPFSCGGRQVWLYTPLADQALMIRSVLTGRESGM